jgi:hypothetical protein
MKAAGEVATQMTRVSGFVQRDPHDGASVSQRTDAYLGYDEKNLYVVFVCFDQPGQVRAHEARREDVGDDDTVEVMLDTFHDHRRAYMFQINPLGVQWDAIWSEIPHEEVSGNVDTSFDTLWYSDGKVTPDTSHGWPSCSSLRSPVAPSWGSPASSNENAFGPKSPTFGAARAGRDADRTGRNFAGTEYSVDPVWPAEFLSRSGCPQSR